MNVGALVQHAAGAPEATPPDVCATLARLWAEMSGLCAMMPGEARADGSGT